MSPVPSLPYPLRDGIDAQSGDEVKADLDAIVAVLNHALDKDNVAAAPDFPGTIISSTVGRRIPSNRIEDEAIIATKMAVAIAGVGSAIDAANKVDDGVVVGAHLDGTYATRPAADKLKMGHYSVGCAALFVAAVLLEGATNDRRRTYFGTVTALTLGVNASDLFPQHCWIEAAAVTGTQNLEAHYVQKTGDNDHYFYFSETNYGGAPGALAGFTLHFTYLERVTT